MITLRDAAQQALEALEAVYGESCDAIHALRAALAEPVQEPVGWLNGPYGEYQHNQLYKIAAPQSVEWRIPLYTAPPQRKPLRGEKVYEICRRTLPKTVAGLSFVPEWALPLVRAIERAHGITGPEDKGG